MRRTSAFILGFHGCDRTVGEKILTNQEHLKASENDYDWLGTGIYFWENSALRAWEWADFAKTNPRVTSARINDPFVIGAIIDLGNCLDLMEAEAIREVARGYKELRETCETGDGQMPRNKKIGNALRIRALDCAVINYVHILRETEGEPPFDTVRAAFREGPPLYDNAGFYEQTHVQICVRRPEQIIGYFRPIGIA